MKRVISTILMLGLLLTLAACSTKPSPASPSTAPSAAPAATSSQAPSGETTESTRPPMPEHPFFDVTNTNAYTYRDENGVVRGLALVQVVNTSDIPCKLALCSFTLTDADGAQVHTAEDVFAYPPIIEPGETACYYEEFEPDTAYVGELGLSISIPDPVEAAPVRYEVTQDEQATQGALPFLYRSGSVTNTTEAVGNLVCVAMILYDADHAPLAVAYNYLMEPLAAGAASDFVIENYLLPEKLEGLLHTWEFFSFPIN